GRAVDEDARLGSDARAMRAHHYLLLTRHEGISSPFFHAGRDIVGQPERSGPFFVRIREYADVIEGGIGDEPLELGKIRVRLAREAADEGPPERDVRDLRPDPPEELVVGPAVAGTAHPLEDLGRGMLQRKVDI